MKKINKIIKISEIVPWFDKEKYRKVANLYPSQWYQQLLVRKLIKIATENPSTASYAVKKAIEHIREKPIIDISTDEPLSVFKPYFDIKAPCHKEGVHPVTLQEFLKMEMSFPKEKVDFTKQWLSSNHLNLDLLCDPRSSYVNESISQLVPENEEKIELVSINCTLPLPILMKQFETYLRQKKTIFKNKDKARYKMPDFYDWHRFGILPYLDLEVWQKETGLKIKHEQLINAITPIEEEKDIDSLRTTKKFAEKLLTHGFLEELATLAQFEKT